MVGGLDGESLLPWRAGVEHNQGGVRCLPRGQAVPAQFDDAVQLLPADAQAQQQPESPMMYENPIHDIIPPGRTFVQNSPHMARVFQ